MGCRALMQQSSLGTSVLGDWRKLRALSIHLSSHTVGLYNSHPKPLNAAFEIPRAAIFFPSPPFSVKIVFRQYQVWLPIYCGCEELQLHTESLKYCLLFSPFKVQEIKCQKAIYCGTVSTVLTVVFLFCSASGVPASSQSVRSHQNRKECHRRNGEGEKQSFALTLHSGALPVNSWEVSFYN